MPQALKIVALLSVYNESSYLKGWYENIRGNINHVIVLDDGSTDESLSYVSAQPETIQILQNKHSATHQWNEPLNRKKLIQAGQRVGADWFLTIDPDERLEERFWLDLKFLIASANKNNILAFRFHLRELWDSPFSFRTDGIWGVKTKAAFFRNLGKKHQFDETKWHGEWIPIQILETNQCLQIPYNLYHMRMIKKTDRIARYMRYKNLDPNNTYQQIGYKYLIDEDGLKLQHITKDYIYKGMPNE